MTKSSSNDAATLEAFRRMEAAETASARPERTVEAAPRLAGASTSDMCVGIVEEKANILVRKQKKKLNPADVKDCATQTLPRSRKGERWRQGESVCAGRRMDGLTDG